MTDTLRTRIAAVLRLHQWRATVRMTDDDPVLDCTCGMAFGPHREAHGNTFDCYRDHVADAVIRKLTDAIPPIVATAIQGWVLSEWAAISHHGEADEYEMLKRLDREALQIARYATTHKDWNG